MAKTIFEIFDDGHRVLRTNDEEEFKKEKQKYEENNIKIDTNVRKLYEEVNEHPKEDMIK